MFWLGSVFILAGAAWIVTFLLIHRRAVARARAAESWPQVPCELLESRLREEESTDSDGNTATVYIPELRYAYEVGGRALEGTRLRFGSVRTGSRGKAESWVRPYPAGARASVRYNPEDPADSVLESARPTAGYLIAAAVGLVFVGLGLYAMA